MQKFIEKYIKGDKVIWTIIVVLSLYSLVMAYSSSSNLAFRLAGGNVVPFLIVNIDDRDCNHHLSTVFQF